MLSKGLEASGGRLYLKVAEELQQAIEGGQYRVGQRLPSERDLTERFGVSRPVIREAMIVLELRGFVQTRLGSGVYVNPKSASQPGLDGGSPDADAGPFEVTEVRRLLEGEVAALAAACANQRQIEEMEMLVDRIGDLALSQDSREQADRAFHLALARSTGNDLLPPMVANLWDMRYQSPLCAYFFRRARDAGIQPPVDEHQLILDAVRARDADAARDAMRHHLTRVTQSLLVASEADVMDRARLKVEERRFAFARRAGIDV